MTSLFQPRREILMPVLESAVVSMDQEPRPLSRSALIFRQENPGALVI